MKMDAKSFGDDLLQVNAAPPHDAMLLQIRTGQNEFFDLCHLVFR